MINRRTFLNSIGTAILGTAIALRIPDILIPKLPSPEFYPQAIEDWFFTKSPLYTYLKEKAIQDLELDPYSGEVRFSYSDRLLFKP